MRLIRLWHLAAASLLAGILLFVRPLPFDSESESHAMVMHCGDQRYSKGRTIEELPKGYQFTAPGCAKCFVESEETRQDFYGQLELYEKAGIPLTEVVLADHYGCKAYGNDDSLQTHTRYLRDAARLLHLDPRSQHLTVRLCIHDMKKHDCIPIEELK